MNLLVRYSVGGSYCEARAIRRDMVAMCLTRASVCEHAARYMLRSWPGCLFLFKFLEGISPSFLWGLGCYGNLVMSALGFKVRMDPSRACLAACIQWIPQIHLWCNNCRPLDGPHCSKAFLIRVLVHVQQADIKWVAQWVTSTGFLLTCCKYWRVRKLIDFSLKNISIMY